MREWAGQIYSGMDFLGDSGIVHRSISPKHILLTVSPEDGEKTVAKLSSFRDSVLYYDVVTSTVRLMAVQEKERAKATSNASCYNFFAPEVFGLGGGGGGNGGVNGGIGNDLYNPIPAEVWSFGATFFFANTRAFPVKYGEVSSAVDVPLAIEGALGRARNLSPEAKGWFSGLLKAGPQERTAFEAIAADPWFRAALPMSAPAAAVEDKPLQQPPPQPFQLHQQLQQQQPPLQPPPQQQQNPPTTFTPLHTDAPGADPFARGGSFQLQPKQHWQQPANLYPPPPPAQMEPPRVPFQLSANNGTPQQQQMQPNSMVGGNFPPPGPPLQQGPQQPPPPPPPPQTGSQPPPVQVVIYQTPNQFGASGKQQQQPQQQLQQQFGAQPPPRPPPPAGPF